MKEFKRLGRLRLWSNPHACTMCRYLFHDIQQNVFKPQNFSAGIKLLGYSIKGAEIVMGFNPQWRKEYHTVICVGDCTRHVAKEGGYIYIPGCPPSPDDLNKIFRKKHGSKPAGVESSDRFCFYFCRMKWLEIIGG